MILTMKQPKSNIFFLLQTLFIELAIQAMSGFRHYTVRVWNFVFRTKKPVPPKKERDYETPNGWEKYD